MLCIQPAKGRPKFPDVLLIGVVCLVLYLAGNSQISLWDRDEPRYAQATREMLQSGDYVVPTFNSEPRYHKPVLIYWLMAVSFTLFGENEFAARFCSAIAGTITSLLTYQLGCRMGGRSVGIAASLMLAVSPFMMVQSKLATTDAVLTAMLVGAMTCAYALFHSGPSWLKAMTFWTLLGLSVLTKGPIGPAILGLSIAVWLFLTRKWSVLGHLKWVAGLLLLATILLPWGIAVYVATDGDFYREAIGTHVIARSLAPMEGHSGFPGYYLLTSLAGLFPWSIVLPLGLRGVLRWARQDGPGSFLLGWIIGPMILLEFVRTKLPNYFLPVYPAMAVLIARGSIQLHAAGKTLANSRFGTVPVVGLLLVFVPSSVLLGVLAVTAAPPELAVPLLSLAAVLGGGACIAGYLFLRWRDRAAWISLVTAWALTGLVVSGCVLPRAEIIRVERIAALELQKRAGGQTPIVLFAFREPSLIFYIGRPVPVLATTEELARFVQDHGPVLTLLRDGDLEILRSEAAVELDICQRISAPPLYPIPTRSLYMALVSPAQQSAIARDVGQYSDLAASAKLTGLSKTTPDPFCDVAQPLRGSRIEDVARPP